MKYTFYIVYINTAGERRLAFVDAQSEKLAHHALMNNKAACCASIERTENLWKITTPEQEQEMTAAFYNQQKKEA